MKNNIKVVIVSIVVAVIGFGLVQWNQYEKKQERLDAQRKAEAKWHERKLYKELRHDDGINWLDRLPHPKDKIN